MRTLSLLLTLSSLLSSACRESAERIAADEPTRLVAVDTSLGLGFELLDPGFAGLVDTAAGIEVLASGFSWSEGPVWVPELGAVLFSDVPHNVVYRWSPATDEPMPTAGPTDQPDVVGVDTFLFPSGYWEEPNISGEAGANGLHLDAEGRLLLAQHGARQVARLEVALADVEASGYAAVAKTDYTPLATSYRGGRFNSPNDLAVLPSGEILFTDPTYGVDKTFGESARELDITGVYRIDPAAAPTTATLLYREFERPNGIGLTPAADSFFVASSKSGAPRWVLCPVPAAGDTVLVDCSDFADASGLVGPDRPGNADGFVVLPSGHLLATGPGGVLLYGPSGRHLGTIRTGRATANVTLGGADGRDVFITAANLLLRARLTR